MEFQNHIDLEGKKTKILRSLDYQEGKLVEKEIDIEKPVDVFGVAKFLEKKPNTVRNWIATGRYDIPHFRLGNKSMFFLSRVTAWCRTLSQ